MPSGPKKRRAAKKKNDSNGSSTNPEEEKLVAAVEFTEGFDVFEGTDNNKTAEENKGKDCESVDQMIENNGKESESVVNHIVLETLLITESIRSFDGVVHGLKKNEVKEDALVGESAINDSLAIVNCVVPVVKDDVEISQEGVVLVPHKEPLRCPPVSAETFPEMFPNGNEEKDCHSVDKINQNKCKQTVSVGDQIILETPQITVSVGDHIILETPLIIESVGDQIIVETPLITEPTEISSRSFDGVVHMSKKNEVKEDAFVGEGIINDPPAVDNPDVLVLKKDLEISQKGIFQDPPEEPLGPSYNEPSAMVKPVDVSVLKENIAKNFNEAEVTSVELLGTVVPLGMVKPVLPISKDNVNISLKESEDSLQEPPDFHFHDPQEVVNPIVSVLKENVVISPAEASPVESNDQMDSDKNEPVEVKTLLIKVLHQYTEIGLKLDKLTNVTDEISLGLSQLSEKLN